MFTGNPVRQRNENPNYVAYFYESGIVQRYLDSKGSLLAGLLSPAPSTYDFSSDLTGRTAFHHGASVEQIIANGYLAIPRADPVAAIISDKKHTSWLGLDDVIGQIRRRYELYAQNMYELDIAKCAAANCLHNHEAYHGPADSRIAYSVNKRLDGLYRDQRAERVNLWKDISKLRLALPENAQSYLTAYRKLSILEDSQGDAS
ncbi:MAG: hypothetical protein JXN61_05060 [Sedimentisphaerales bacterium]|nr:hypothetical protein [Sedimentisphaerales bacterium]